jgi:hypothetical protein
MPMKAVHQLQYHYCFEKYFCKNIFKVRADCANYVRIMAEGALGAEIFFAFARKLIECAQVTSGSHI